MTSSRSILETVSECENTPLFNFAVAEERAVLKGSLEKCLGIISEHPEITGIANLNDNPEHTRTLLALGMDSEIVWGVFESVNWWPRNVFISGRYSLLKSSRMVAVYEKNREKIGVCDILPAFPSPNISIPGILFFEDLNERYGTDFVEKVRDGIRELSLMDSEHFFVSNECDSVLTEL